MNPTREIYTGVPRGDALIETWEPSATTVRLITANGAPPSIPFDAVVGGWALFRWWHVASGTTRFLAEDGNVAAPSGWDLRIIATEQIGFRVTSGAPALVPTPFVGPATHRRSNVVLVELDVAGAVIAITLNNGTRATAACVGYTVPPGSESLVLAGRRTPTSGLSPGGLHAVAGASGQLLSAGDRAAIWAGPARRPGFSGIEDLVTVDHAWEAHNLTDRIGASALSASGTGSIINRFRPDALAW